MKTKTPFLLGLLLLVPLLAAFGLGVPQTALAEIGVNSCLGTQACFQGPQSDAVLGDFSCNGSQACMQQSHTIGDDSCNGVQACFQQGPNPSRTVGNNSCNGDKACSQNFGDVGNNSCNGPGGPCIRKTGVGDCEFNTVLVPECDSDDDGVPDDQDNCPNSDLSPTVVIDGCDSGVANALDAAGCTIIDLVDGCADDAKNHGKFVSCVSKLTNDLKKEGIIAGRDKGAIQRCAAQADLP